MLTSLTSNVMLFNPGVLFIPVSIGLFMGMAAARIAATFLFCLIYLMLAGLLVAPLVLGSSIVVHFHDSSVQGTFPLILVVVAVAGSVVGLIHWFLYTRPFDEHLQTGKV